MKRSQPRKEEGRGVPAEDAEYHGEDQGVLSSGNLQKWLRQNDFRVCPTGLPWPLTSDISDIPPNSGQTSKIYFQRPWKWHIPELHFSHVQSFFSPTKISKITLTETIQIWLSSFDSVQPPPTMSRRSMIVAAGCGATLLAAPGFVAPGAPQRTTTERTTTEEGLRSVLREATAAPRGSGATSGTGDLWHQCGRGKWGIGKKPYSPHSPQSMALFMEKMVIIKFGHTLFFKTVWNHGKHGYHWKNMLMKSHNHSHGMPLAFRRSFPGRRCHAGRLHCPGFGRAPGEARELLGRDCHSAGRGGTGADARDARIALGPGAGLWGQETFGWGQALSEIRWDGFRWPRSSLRRRTSICILRCILRCIIHQEDVYGWNFMPSKTASVPNMFTLIQFVGALKTRFGQAFPELAGDDAVEIRIISTTGACAELRVVY